MPADHRPARAGVAAGVAIFCGLAAVFGVLRGAPAAERGEGAAAAQHTQALFSWQAFSAQQDVLAHRASDLAARVAGDDRNGGAGSGAGGGDKGAAIREVLRTLMRGLRRRGSAAARHPAQTYVPMDQELAILKVQKQMRTEHKFGTDRIEGGGDVAAVVNEAEQADERSALMEDPDTGPDTKTEHLYENCEDGSLTAEDADLCGRRASAIKMITRAAIQQQLAKNPPVSPRDVADAADTERENKARKDLMAYALIGKQYVALMHEEKKADADTQAQRNALLAQGRSKRHADKRPASAGRRSGAPPPRARVHAKGATAGAAKVRGRDADARQRGPASKRRGRRPSAAASLRSKHAAAQVESAVPTPSTSAAADDKGAQARGAQMASRSGVGTQKTGKQKTGKQGVGDLGPLQDIADAMPKHLTTPKTDSKTRLADLESAITDTQAKLAKEKMRFTKEMLKRQKQLQAEFLQSMQQIHAGLSVVDDVGIPGEQSESEAAPSGKGMLAAEQAAFMQRQRDSVIAAAASAAGPAPAATQPTNPVVTEVTREIAASHLFRHPPKPSQAASRSSVEDKEKAVINDALEAQFDQVASDGSVAPKVRHDKWTDLMSQMSQALALEKPAAAMPADPPARAAQPGAQGLGKLKQSQSKTAGGGAAVGAASVHAGSHVASSSKAKSRREGLRLLSSLPGFKQRLHTGHVGPASYDALASAAEQDMRAAIAKGAPTLAAATKDAMKADELAHNPQVASSLVFCWRVPAC